jgi:small subunit ribosomal protein S6
LRYYEMILIVHPNVPEEELSLVIDKVSALIKGQQGEIIKVDQWGKRKCAHKIDKCQKGYYCVVYFTVNPAFLAEIEKTLRYDEKILRYQTVKIEKEKLEAPVVKDEAPVQEAAVPGSNASAADL